MNVVDCIKKREHQNPHERITHIGGKRTDNGNRFYITSDDAIQMIESGMYDFHVIQGGKNVKVITYTMNGKKFLKTEADGYVPDNLLALNECK